MEGQTKKFAKYLNSGVYHNVLEHNHLFYLYANNNPDTTLMSVLHSVVKQRRKSLPQFNSYIDTILKVFIW